MNPPTDFERIAVVLPVGVKRMLVKACKKRRHSITWVVTRLITGYLDAGDSHPLAKAPPVKQRAKDTFVLPPDAVV